MAEHADVAALASRVGAFRARLEAAARDAGRDPASIRVVAATKTRSAAEVSAVVAAGIEDAGENRVQEWLGKREACPPHTVWHLIGPLQRNKVNKIVGQVALFHALDDRRIAAAIDARARSLEVRQPVLLQVNTSREAKKAGVPLEDAEAAARDVASLPGVELQGFCTVASIEEPAACFARLVALRDRIAAAVPSARELSMGMSDDLEIAIAHGATIVRPGTALFGPRPAML